jgi:hypothetical protein
MENIIGQEKLVNKLKSYTFGTMPKTLLFVGEKGSGKHFISQQFAKYLNLDLVEITSQTTAEDLIDYYQSSIPKIYLINLADFVEKQQHKFLKFIEEPSSNMRVILLAESEVGILPTVLNRCIKHTFEDYTVEQLKQFSWAIQINNDLVYKLCHTPGQLLAISSVDSLEALQALCTKLLDGAAKMPYVSFINYSYKINCKDDYKKFDFDLFFNILIHTAYEKYINGGGELMFKLYQYLINRKQLLINKTLSKEHFLVTSLSELWRIANEWNYID